MKYFLNIINQSIHLNVENILKIVKKFTLDRPPNFFFIMYKYNRCSV